MFGIYTDPLPIFKLRRDPDLEAAYGTTYFKGPLPFGAGYHVNADDANLLLATKEGSTSNISNLMPVMPIVPVATPAVPAFATPTPKPTPIPIRRALRVPIRKALPVKSPNPRVLPAISVTGQPIQKPFKAID